MNNFENHPMLRRALFPILLFFIMLAGFGAGQIHEADQLQNQRQSQHVDLTAEWLETIAENREDQAQWQALTPEQKRQIFQIIN